MKANKSLIVAVLALGCMLLGVLGAWLTLLPPMIGFAMFILGGVLGLVALVWGLVVKLRKKQRGGGLAAAIGALPFLVVAATAGLMVGKSGPGINDITTDVSDTPLFTKSTIHGEYPNEFVAKAASAYPKVEPLLLAVEPTAALTLAVAVAKSRGWEIVHTDDSGFEAYELTNLFRFRDDIVVRVRPEPAGGSRLDMRSASRDGKADFGVNAGRIESFLSEVNKRAQ